MFQLTICLFFSERNQIRQVMQHSHFTFNFKMHPLISLGQFRGQHSSLLAHWLSVLGYHVSNPGEEKISSFVFELGFIVGSRGASQLGGTF